jgi:hypothetical protein
LIKVHPALYRLLWIAVAVLGAILLFAPLMLLLDDVTASNETSRYVLLASGAVGLFTLLYALRRLIWPLKAPPVP